MANNVVVVISGQDQSGAVFDQIQKHLQDTRDKAKETSDALGEMGEFLKRGLETAGIAVSVREITRSFQEMVKSSTEMAVQIGHMSQQTGISTENLSVLRYAAQQTGIDFDVLGKGFKKFAEEVISADSGNKQSIQTFERLGISQEQVKSTGNDMFAAMEMVANKFQSMPDGILKNAEATALFGRAGQQLIPILDQGADGLDKFRSEAEAAGLVMSKDMVEQMEQLHRATATLDSSMQGLKLSIAEAFAPTAANWAKSISDYMNEWRVSPSHMTKATVGGLFGFYDMDYEEAQAAAAVKATQTPKPADDSAAAKKAPIELPDTNQKAARDQSILAAQERFDASIAQLARAEASNSEAIAKAHTQALLDINEAAHKEGLRSDSEYLGAKQVLEQRQFDIERSALNQQQGALKTQMAGLQSQQPKNAQQRLELQAKINELKTKELEIQSKLTELDERATKAAQDADVAWAKTSINMPDQTPDLSGLFQHAAPNVTLAQKPLLDPAAIEGEAEKFAHGVFDPLFNMGEKWNDQWKQIRNNMLKDVGQLLESQLFGALFGDASGRGGKGWNGMSWHGNTAPAGPGATAAKGLESQSGGLLGGLINHFFGSSKSSPVTSNGAFGSGAGATPNSAASAMQMGNSGSGSAGVNIVMNNTGQPVQVDSAQHQSDGFEQHTVNIFLKQLETNGPVAQGIMGLFSM